MNTFSVSTDETLRETMVHGSGDYPFSYYLDNIWQFDLHCIDWHWHYEFEFMTIAEGNVTCLIDTDKIELSQGQGLFINSSILHRFQSSAPTPVPNIVFSPAFIASKDSLIFNKYILPVIRSARSYQIFDPSVQWQSEILQILEQIYHLQSEKEAEQLHIFSLVIQLWNLLYHHLEPSYDPSILHHPNHKQARLQIMMQFIHDHYQEFISLDDIAASASICKSGALRIFQTGIQISPVSYLIQYRLAKAASLLSDTQKSVSSVAAETGFASSGYFCRKFRERYKMTPNEYRKNQLFTEP